MECGSDVLAVQLDDRLVERRAGVNLNQSVPTADHVGPTRKNCNLNLLIAGAPGYVRNRRQDNQAARNNDHSLHQFLSFHQCEKPTLGRYVQIGISDFNLTPAQNNTSASLAS